MARPIGTRVAVRLTLALGRSNDHAEMPAVHLTDDMAECGIPALSLLITPSPRNLRHSEYAREYEREGVGEGMRWASRVGWTG